VPPKARGGRQAALAFIFVTIVLDTLGFGITIPTLPLLIEGFTGGNAAAAGAINGFFLTIFGLMQFVFAPVLGALSDRFGRRPVLILSGFGLGFDYVIMAIAPNLSWLLVGRILSGITASSFAAAAAYVADVTPPERRAAAFGAVGAAWGIGFIVGPAFGGLVAILDPRYPFWAAASFSFVSATYGLLLLPESLSLKNRERFSLRKANPLGSLVLLRSNRTLFGLGAVFFVQFLGFQVLPTMFTIYTHYRIGWGITEVGLSLGLVGALSITVQGFLVKRFITRFGERAALIVGLVFGAAALVVWGLAFTPVLFIVAIFVFAPIGLLQPALQSLMTRYVRPSEQGQLQGANASINGLTAVIGPILYGVVWAASIQVGAPITLPGLVFFLAAVLMLVSIALAVRVVRVPAGTPAPNGPAAIPDGNPSTSPSAVPIDEQL
jgi:DHA1 family tetracycline resistance protein-like MFS transporter